MGSRPSKLSPSVLGSHSQIAKEDSKLYSNMRGASTPFSMALTTKSTVGSGSPGNDCITNPRSLGRSAIYNMARTPYLKVTFKHSSSFTLLYPSFTLLILFCLLICLYFRDQALTLMALDFQCPQHPLVSWKIVKNLRPSQWYILVQKCFEF